MAGCYELGGNAPMDEVLLDVMLVLVASVLVTMLWRQLKRHALLRQADRISRSIGDGEAASGICTSSSSLRPTGWPRAQSHPQRGRAPVPGGRGARCRSSGCRQLERRSPSFS